MVIIHKNKLLAGMRLPAAAFLIFLTSCANHVKDISFTSEDSAYPQPVTRPLELSAPRKLNLITIKKGVIRPEIKPLNLASLPSTPLFTSPFKPFLKPPKVTHFNFNALPDTAFSLDSIPSKPLNLRFSVLPPPKMVTSAMLTAKTGVTLSDFEVGQGQGLQDKSILCLYKDNNGLVWIGTDKGLYRYDGQFMQTYPIYTDNGIGGIIGDRDGRIWFIDDQGIGVLNLKNGTIGHSAKIWTPYPFLPRMILDNKGRIWITQISTRGAAVVDPATLTFKSLDRTNGLSGLIRYGGALEDKDNRIWITTNNGADIIDAAKGRMEYFYKSSGLSSDSLGPICSDPNGVIWMAYRNGGLDAIDINNGTITEYGKDQGINFDNTFKVIQDHLGRMWMATKEGLAIIDPAKNIFKIFNTDDGFPQDYILDLMEDQKNRMWVGTYPVGLIIVDQDAMLTYPVGQVSLSAQFEDSEGNLWEGTNSKGILIVNEKDNTVRTLDKIHGLGDNFLQAFYEENGKIFITSFGGLDIVDLQHHTISHLGKKEGMSSDSIFSMSRDYRNNIWLTGQSAGVQVIDSSMNRIRMATKTEGLSDNLISSMKRDNQGHIWLATYRGGIDIADPSTWTVRTLNDAPGLSDTCYRELYLDNHGKMWIGTDRGIYVADPVAGTLTTITTKEGLSNDYGTAFADYKNEIIAGTYHKVDIITPPNAAPGSTNDSANNKWKISLLAGSEDLVERGSGWDINMITSNGRYVWGDLGAIIINSIRPEVDSEQTLITGISIFGKQRHFNNPVSLKSGDTLWDGNTYFVKDQHQVNTGYDSKNVFKWDNVSGPYNLPVNLEIPYNMNNIQFQYGQKNLGRKDTVFYSYILEGFDKQWSDPSDKTTTENYMNLPTGKYVFKVRSQAISGEWNPAASFSFEITPPWWKTWWAYLVYFVVIAGSIWQFIRYRSRQLMRENRILEEKVNHRTEQLRQSLEDLKATQSQLIQTEKMASLGELTAGIAHEIQNPLNFVNNFAEINKELIEELEDQADKGNMDEVKMIAKDIKENSEKINHHGKRAEVIVKGMLQHSRSSSGQKEATDINALCDEYLRLSWHGIRAKDKSFNAKFETRFDDNVGKIRVVPQDIGRVVLNLINNAFYAVHEKSKQHIPGYEPTITVSTKKLDKKIEINVKDNGNGIPDSIKEKIFQPFFTTKPAGQGTGLGLSLSYDIIKAHGGDLKAESKEGTGTEFIIQLPVV
jgi:signal transduction histidine kinase/ligand-binding sensor domain-containing protein